MSFVSRIYYYGRLRAELTHGRECKRGKPDCVLRSHECCAQFFGHSNHEMIPVIDLKSIILKLEIASQNASSLWRNHQLPGTGASLGNVKGLLCHSLAIEIGTDERVLSRRAAGILKCRIQGERLLNAGDLGADGE